jgi:hypothetical protein
MAMRESQLVTSPLTLTAGAAVTAKRFVGYNGQHAGAGVRAMGVSRYDAALGEPITLDGPGNIVQVTAGAAVSAGAAVMSDANGKAITATALAVAAPTVDKSKLTIDAGATPVTSTAANGAILTAATGFLTAGAITGAVLPSRVNGTALSAASQDGDTILVRVE